MINIFPQTQKLLGNDLFDSLSKAFSAHPKDFPQSLKITPLVKSTYSFIPELAELEYALSLGYIQNNFGVKNCQNVYLMYKDHQGKKLALNPNLKLLKCRFPIWDIYQTLKTNNEIPNFINFDLQPKIKNKFYYVIDHPKEGAAVHSVSQKTFLLLEGILLGHPFRKIAEELSSPLEENEFNNTLQKVLANNWVA